MRLPVTRTGKQLRLYGRHAADCADEDMAALFELLLNDRTTISPTRSIESAILILSAIVGAFIAGLILGA